MTSTAAVSDTTSGWLRSLALVAVHSNGCGSLKDVTAVLARATGSAGAVLWEAPAGGVHGRVEDASVLAVWLEGDAAASLDDLRTEADPLTGQALLLRTLALADGRASADRHLFGRAVQAALPLDYADGSRGALTLLGANELSDASFDVAAELLGLLPHVLTAMRERSTLTLVNSCNAVLHQADVESATQPLTRERLSEHLARVCTSVAEELQCTDVGLYLEDPCGAGGRYELFAAAPGSQVPESTVVELGGGVPGPREPGGEAPAMEVPVSSGDHAWGAIRCSGAYGPPYRFTQSDLSLLRPVAAQLAQYWATWLHRRTMLQENDSWHRLASGITSFNRLLAEELRRTGDAAGRREQLVAAAAVELVQNVVRESHGASVSLAEGPSTALTEVVATGSTGEGTATSRFAENVYLTGRQRCVTEVRELSRNGAPPGWLVGTPIKVAEKAYGVLTALGPASAVPPNAPQVYEIVGDQLGLYRHLEHTLGALQDAEQTLKTTLRGQAEAMEDLKHQLVSPLRTATDRTELVLRTGRFDSRVEAQLKAVRGLCRKASRVAMSAGVFAALSKSQLPQARKEHLGAEDLLRMLIAAADDAQLLSDPGRRMSFEVDRDSVRALRRRLVIADVSFLQQCLGNLLDNAGKYGYQDTEVHVAATVGDSAFELHVTSTGLPLTQAEAKRSLERNWRGDTARSSTGEGSGIGLWIVDNLMRSMGGRVKLDVRQDVTKVRLALPSA